MAEILFTNFATSTIADVGGIASGDLSLSVQAGDGALFPNPSGGDYFYATLIDTSGNREIVKVTARVTDTFTIVREQDNTNARAFSENDKVELRLNAAALEAMAQRPSAPTEDNIATFDADGNIQDGSVPVEAVTEYGTIYVPAGAMVPTETSGAAFGQEEYATNDVMREYLAFDGTSDEFAGFSFPMPENWDRSTIKAKFFWAPGDSACSAGDIVTWGLQAAAKSNDDAIDGSYGTAQFVDDTVLAGKDGDGHLSGIVSVTVGGTPALGDMIDFKISRDADGSDGSDDMTEDAWLYGVWIQYKKSNTVSVWS